MSLHLLALMPWMRRLSNLVLLALVLAPCLGCSERTYFSCKVTVLDDGGQTNENGERNGPEADKPRKNMVTIIGNRLFANGKYYGKLKSGSSVLLDKDGQVYVNGEKREVRKADPLSKNELADQESQLVDLEKELADLEKELKNAEKEEERETRREIERKNLIIENQRKIIEEQRKMSSFL